MAPRGRSAAAKAEDVKEPEKATESAPDPDVSEETQLPEQMEEPDGTPVETGEAVPDVIVPEPKKVEEVEPAKGSVMSEFLPAQYDIKDEDYLPAQSR